MNARPIPIRELLPWQVTDISLRPFPGMWSFNPSVHFDGTTWRCSLRCADYAMPDGKTVRGELASPAYVKNKNVMVELAPDTLRPIEVTEMCELDGYPRIQGCTYLGFADLRLFMTPEFGLQAIAAAMQLGKPGDARAATSHKKTHRKHGASHPAEQVILTLNEDYDIVEAFPVRGWWSSGRAQKNWSPFDRSGSPMFMQSIDRSVLFDREGPVNSVGALSAGLRAGYERAAARVNPSSGHAGYHELRGGTQLVHVGDALRSIVGDVPHGAWLSLAHDMRYEQGRKFYWHLFYAVDSYGRMLARSEPFKLAEHWIEFAAGLAIDGDRAVISFGVDDMECKLAVTSLSAILELLQPVP